MNSTKLVKAGRIVGGAAAGVIAWAAAWTLTVLVNACFFDGLSRVVPELDYGGDPGFGLMFFALWAGGRLVGAPALGAMGSVGAGRRWRRRGMLIGGCAGTLLGGVIGLSAGAGLAATPLGGGNLGTAVALYGAALLAISCGMAGMYVGGHRRAGTEQGTGSSGSPQHRSRMHGL